MRSLYGGFCTEKTIRIFSVLYSITPKELVSFESTSGVEYEYPVNPVQPLGHFGCRAANGREAGEMIGHSWGNSVLMFFVAAFSHLHRVEALITEQASRY